MSRLRIAGPPLLEDAEEVVLVDEEDESEQADEIDDDEVSGGKWKAEPPLGRLGVGVIGSRAKCQFWTWEACTPPIVVLGGSG